MRRALVNWDGRETPGEDLSWKVAQDSERWNEYTTEDGTLIRVRHIVTRITRLDERNQDGEPIYCINTQAAIVANVPGHMMVDEAARANQQPPPPPSDVQRDPTPPPQSGTKETPPNA